MSASLIAEREKTHGRWPITASIAQKLKQLVAEPGAGDLSFTQREAIDMILTKVARIYAGNPDHIDHWRDIAGYAALGGGFPNDGTASSAPAFWYLASPYRGHPGGFDAAMEEATRYAARLIDLGIEVYSPIVHSHPAAQFVKTAPPEGDFWLHRQLPFMAAACGMLVAHMPGHDKSAGIAWERNWFKAAGKPTVAIPRTIFEDDGGALAATLARMVRK